jgi:hypothetical protein
MKQGLYSSSLVVEQPAHRHSQTHKAIEERVKYMLYISIF